MHRQDVLAPLLRTRPYRSPSLYWARHARKNAPIPRIRMRLPQAGFLASGASALAKPDMMPLPGIRTERQPGKRQGISKNLACSMLGTLEHGVIPPFTSPLTCSKLPWEWLVPLTRNWETTRWEVAPACHIGMSWWPSNRGSNWCILGPGVGAQNTTR